MSWRPARRSLRLIARTGQATRVGSARCNALSTLTNDGHITNNGYLKNVLDGSSTLINHGTIDNNGILLNDVDMTKTGTITVGLLEYLLPGRHGQRAKRVAGTSLRGQTRRTSDRRI